MQNFKFCRSIYYLISSRLQFLHTIRNIVSKYNIIKMNATLFYKSRVVLIYLILEFKKVIATYLVNTKTSTINNKK